MTIVSLCNETLQRIKGIRALRQQRYTSTKRLKSDAELIGLAGEIAWLAYLGIDLEEAFQHLIDNAGVTDEGYDAVVGGQLVDFKTTASPGKRVYINARNPYSHRATIWALAYCSTLTDDSAVIHLVGWNYAPSLRPYLIHKPNRFPALDLKRLLQAQLLNLPYSLREMGGAQQETA